MKEDLVKAIELININEDDFTYLVEEAVKQSQISEFYKGYISREIHILSDSQWNRDLQNMIIDFINRVIDYA